MADLFNQQISATYSGLLKTTSNGVLSSSLAQITDGRGNGSQLYLSTSKIKFYNAYEFPTNDGSANQVLKTDGSGVLTWEDDANTGTVQVSGTPTANEVAIWTDATTIKGDASFTMSSSTFQVNNSTASSQSNLIISNNDTAINSIPGNILFNSNTLTNYKTLAQIFATKTDADLSDASGKLNFATTDAGTASTKFIINSNGLSEFFGSVNAYNTPSLKLYSLGQEGYFNTEFLEIKKSSTNAILNVNKVGTGSIRGLEFQTGGSPKLTITSGGNVGIGGTPPSITGYTALSINNATNGAILDLEQGDAMKARFIATATTATIETASGIPFAIDVNGNGSSDLSISSTGLATFQLSALTNPSGVDANTGVIVKNNGWSGITLLSSAATGSFLTFGDADAGFRGRILYLHGSTDAMVFETASAERMRISSVGAIGQSVTPISDPYVAGAEQWMTYQIGKGGIIGAYKNNNESMFGFNTYVSAPSGLNKAVISGINGTAIRCYADQITFNHLTSSGTSQTQSTKLTISSGGDVLFRATAMPSASNLVGSAFKYDSKSRMTLVQASDNNNLTDLQEYFNSNGAVGKIQTNGSATLFTTSSDYRLKENVTPITDALSRVNQLKPSRFNFIADADKIVDGFLAHEVQDIIPEAISGEKDAMKDEEFELTPRVEAVIDEDGNVITEAVEAVMETRSVPDYQGIDQSKIVPLLTAAIQEQQTIIEDLKARIETLEG